MRVLHLLPLALLALLLPLSLAQVTFNEDTQVNSILAAASLARPVMNCSFTVAPSSTLNYRWMASDPSDTTANQGVHQGLAYLNGVGSSLDASAGSYAYIDLNAASGPNSCGAALPTYGAGVSAAYTFEFVLKFGTLNQGWAKILDLGDGNATPNADDFTITWLGSDNNRIGVESYLNATVSTAASEARHGIVEAFRNPVAGQWYHIVLAVQAATTTPAGPLGANWYVWINGQQQAYATTLVSGAILTAIQGANFPLNAPKPQSYIGRSNWADAMLNATLDSFRLYNYLMPTAQVQQLANIYGLNIPVTAPVSAYTPATTTETTQFNAIVTSNSARQPIFNAPFSSSPYSAAATTATAANYVWAPFDSTDNNTLQALHQGVVTLTGTTSIDLNAASGPSSIGQVLPSVVGGGQGLSVELVVKATATRTWSKFIDLGTGPGMDTIDIGWYSSTGQWEVENYDNVVGTGLGAGTVAMTYAVFLTQPVLNQWYHIMVTMTPTNTTAWLGNWVMYVNGQVVQTQTGGNYPLPVTRVSSYIGGSDWADAAIAATYDAVRIYDYAVSPAMVSQLATMYGLNAGSSSGGSVGFNEDVQVNSILAAASLARPVMNCSFTTQPASTLNYRWMASDPSDTTANQGVHQGLAYLNGVGSSLDASAGSYAYIDLNAASGPNSCGAALPTYGAGVSAAYTFEFVLKFGTLNQGWAKILDLGDGNATPNADDFTITWLGSDNNRIGVESYLNATVSTAASEARHGIVEAFRNPVAGQWYHIVLAVQAATTTPAGPLGANWYVWINGQQQAYATTLVSGAILTAIQGANFPLNAPKPQSYIGRSNWADAMLNATLDSFRLYNYLMPTAQVQQLANIYGLNIPVTAPVSAYTPATTTETTQFNAIVTSNSARQPIFNAPFSSSPYSAAATTATAANYVWAPFDSTDNNTLQALHQGVVTLTGTTSIDLNAASGPSSIGQVLPSVVGGGQGLSVELVVKATATRTWSKFIDLGTGPGMDTIDIGWYSSTGQWEVENYDNVVGTGLGAGTVAMTYAVFLTQPVLNQWYHIMVTMTPTNTTAWLGNWVMYVNGQVVQTQTGGNYPLPVTRVSSYIGGSDWADAAIAATYDAVRIYDYAVSAQMVGQLAAMYGLNTGVAAPVTYTPPSPINFPAAAEDTKVAAIVPRLAVLNCSFNSNPAGVVTTGALNYQWAQQDPSDTPANQALHQGVVILSGSTAGTSFIDVSTNTGPNSAGCVMPTMSSSYPGLPQGWTFEFVVKFGTTAGGWSKLLDLGNGAGVDDLTVTWFGNDAGRLLVEQYNNASVYPLTQHGEMEFGQAPKAGVWYHIVVGMAPASSAAQGAGAANWYIWINGQQLNWADALSPGAAFTPSQGANYPLGVPRQQSYIGKSDWGADPTFNGTFDAVRGYDYLLTTAQVQALATIYQLNIPTTAPVSYNYGSADAETVAMSKILSRPAVFNAPFASSPYSAAATTSTAAGYTWMANDPTDTAADQAAHQGLVKLSGGYIDLTTATGPNSVGLVLPVIGGVGYAAGASQGLSIELVVKMTAVETWSKLIDLGTGSGLDSLAIGWYSTTDSVEVENYNNAPSGNPLFQPAESTVPFLTAPSINRWYHIMVVMKPSTSITSNTQNTNWGWRASYAIYVNGVQSAVANASMANFPLPIYRQNAYIGKSNWQADANALAVYDALRVYDYAVDPSAIPYLAQSYGCYSGYLSSTGAALAPPVNTQSNGGGGGSSGLSGGAIAGIVIGSVVGAALLLVVVFFVCCRGGGGEKKMSSGTGRDSRRLDEEPSSMGHTGEVEMGEA